MKITETEMSAALHMGPRGLRGTLPFTRVNVVVSDDAY